MISLLRRRDIRDAIVLFGITLIAFAYGDYYDLPPKVFQFALDYASWEVDNLILMSVVFSTTLLVYGFRRNQDLSCEIKARRSAELEARNLARHDPLTGLPNRRFFAEKLDECLRGASDTQRLAVLMLDLDGFKLINDTHGHAVGDKALIAFAERMSGVIRPDTILARVGGDEFAILMPAIVSLDDPAALARRIVGAIAEPFVIESSASTLGVGIGIAVAPDDGTGGDELMRRADLALYRAKADGRSTVRFFEVDMDAYVERRVLIERELRDRLAAKTVVPYYQPLVSLETNCIVGFEALARFEGEDSVLTSPVTFIPIAEECGLIGELGDQVLRRACEDARAWPADIKLAVNISPIQLRDETLGLRILAILGDTGFDPRRLEIEITESALVEHLETVHRIIDQLRQAGIRIAIDDFGTGYATLAQLRTLHLDKIKIDRSFVDGLVKDKESLVIVRAILGLAKGFGLTTTAEGIEDVDQLGQLKAFGCSEGQGYLFGRAIPASKVGALLKLPPAVSAVA